MILLTRMDKQEMYVNPDHIVSIEETPDTVIALYNGHHFIVTESADTIIGRIVTYRAKIIRRSGGQHRKKYLDRQQKSMFRSTTLNQDIACPENCSVHERSPLHNRDF
jgi:flagellar protein FlbD